MRKKLLEEAKSFGLKIYLNSSDKWIIEDTESEKKWSLQEDESERWIISYDEIPPVVLNPGAALEVLKILGENKKLTNNR